MIFLRKNRFYYQQQLEISFNSPLLKAEKLLALLEVDVFHYQVLSSLKFQAHNPVFILLRKLLLAKQQLITTSLLAVLEMLAQEPEVIQLAKRTSILASHVISLVFQEQTAQWEKRLSSAILKELHPKYHSFNHECIGFARGEKTKSINITSALVEKVLRELLQEPEPLTQAASLYALNQLNSELAKAEAHRLLTDSPLDNLVRETAISIFTQSYSVASTLEQLLHLLQQEKYQSLDLKQLKSIVAQIQKPLPQECVYSERNLTEVALSRSA